MSLRSRVIKLAYSNPGPLQDALLPLLSVRTASLPRATGRSPGDKFRLGLEDWMVRDIQSKLEAGGVPQKIIDTAIQSLTGNNGPLFVTTWSGGYTAHKYRNFATQQDAVDWLAGKTEVEAAGGSLGHNKYPSILEAYISKYGAGNDAIRDKVRAQWNKLLKHQKAMATVFVKSGVSLQSPAAVKELETSIETMNGELAQRFLPVLEWAAKVPMWPTNFHW